MAHSMDSKRRRLGLLFLGGAIGLLLLGFTVLRRPLGNGVLFVLFWLTCFLLTGLALLTALLDAWIVRTRARQQQTELFKETLLPKDSKTRPGDPTHGNGASYHGGNSSDKRR